MYVHFSPLLFFSFVISPFLSFIFCPLLFLCYKKLSKEIQYMTYTMHKSTMRIGDRFNVNKNQSFDQKILQNWVLYVLFSDSPLYICLLPVKREREREKKGRRQVKRNHWNAKKYIFVRVYVEYIRVYTYRASQRLRWADQLVRYRSSLTCFSIVITWS